ncbi:MAG: nucleotidyl transferase AbiEii/AbiGii toxin family protein [Candidatus Woesearchaeota archaeon]
MVFKKISKKEILEIIAIKKFDYDLLIKDYYITILLYLMKDIKGIYFKGGTALQKTILDHTRLSEDIDFTLDREIKHVIKEIENVINESKKFGIIKRDKNVDKFVRLIVPYKSKLGYGEIFIDLNERSKLILKPKNLEIKNFYPNIPNFNFPCLNIKEMIAEKVAAAIDRNKPRDHYDIYKLIKHGFTIDMNLVKKKCEKSGNDPSILKMFNNAKKLYKRWNEDMIPLLVDEVTFQEVMQTLSKHFNLKYEKEILK